MMKQACYIASGLNIAVGPTRSRDTTILYAILNLINSSGKNILIIENPVGYELQGITQVSLDPEQIGFCRCIAGGIKAGSGYHPGWKNMG